MRPAIFAALFVFAAIVCGIFYAATVHGGTTATASMTILASPIVSSVRINNDQASIILTGGTTTDVNVTASISDNCGGAATATETIMLYRSGVGSSSCQAAQDNLNCYIAAAFTTSTCSGSITNMTTTFPVQYYAQATDVSSQFPGQNWIATVIFDDPLFSPVSADSTGVSSTNDMATLVALNVPISSVNYGSLSASSTTSSTNQLVNVENDGNASTTIQVNGTALTSAGNSIATSSQHYATSSFVFGGLEQQLSAAATTITGINIAPVFNFPIGGNGWTNVTTLPYTDSGPASVAYNGYLYTLGGNVNSGPATATVLFAPINATGSLGAWSTTQATPASLTGATTVAYNGYVYVIGGTIGGGASSTVLFAPINATGSLGAWITTQPFPFTLGGDSGIAYNGYIYAIGGSANGSTTSTVLFAHINATGSLGAWSQTQALPYPVSIHSSAIYNGYIYAIGGLSGGSITSTVVFAPINATGSLGAWTSTQALPYINDSAAAVAYDGNLYSIAGKQSALTTGTTSTVSFAPINATGSIGTWINTLALPYALSVHASVLYNGYLYTVAGTSRIGPSQLDTSTVLFAPLNVRSTYWGATAPNGTAKGNYTGSVTFTAVYSP